MGGIPIHISASQTNNIHSYGTIALLSLPEKSYLILNDQEHYDILIYLHTVELIRPDITLFAPFFGNHSLISRHPDILQRHKPQDTMYNQKQQVWSFQEFVEQNIEKHDIFVAGDTWLKNQEFWTSLCNSSCGCALALKSNFSANKTEYFSESGICRFDEYTSEEFEILNDGLLWKIKKKNNSEMSELKDIQWKLPIAQDNSKFMKKITKPQQVEPDMIKGIFFF